MWEKLWELKRDQLDYQKIDTENWLGFGEQG